RLVEWAAGAGGAEDAAGRAVERAAVAHRHLAWRVAVVHARTAHAAQDAVGESVGLTLGWIVDGSDVELGGPSPDRRRAGALAPLDRRSGVGGGAARRLALRPHGRRL